MTISGRAEQGFTIGKQVLNGRGLACIAGECPSANLAQQRIEIVRGARRQRNLNTLLGERAGKRRTQACAGADDEGGLELEVGHGCIQVCAEGAANRGQCMVPRGTEGATTTFEYSGA